MDIFDPNSIVKPYKDEANSNVPTKIASELEKAYPNLSAQERQKIIDELSPIFGDDDTNWLSLLSNLTSLLNKLQLSIDSQTLSALTKNLKLNNKLTSSALQNNRMEQNAETSQKLEEPKADDTKFSSIVDNQDADNSLAEDYPETYGSINDVGDYVKVNRKQKSMTLVHNSGSRLVIDQNGNITAYSTGSLKLVVDSSMAIAVTGGLDISATDGIYIHGKEIEVESDSSFKLKSTEIEAEGTNGITLKGMSFEVKDAMTVKFPDSMMSEFGGMVKIAQMCTAAGFANG